MNSRTTGLHALFFLVCLSLCSSLVSCSKDRGEIKLSGATMGTVYHIKVINPSSEINLIDLQQDIDIALAGLDLTFSTYKENSELSLLNRAPINAWMPVSAELFSVVKLAKEISEKTNGAYDVTVGPLVDLWGFGSKDIMAGLPPAEKDLRKALGEVCFSCIELNESDKAILKQKILEIDLSSIAKGYAVDKIADLLYKRQITNYLVEIGGEVRSRGMNVDGEKWRLGIEKPDAQQQAVQRIIKINGESVATSGDYRNFMEIKGKKYSHIINPITGYPVDHSPASVTVIADNSALADAWATGLTVLGVEKGLALAEQESLAVYFIERDSAGSMKVSMSEGFKPYLADAIGEEEL